MGSGRSPVGLSQACQPFAKSGISAASTGARGSLYAGVWEGVPIQEASPSALLLPALTTLPAAGVCGPLACNRKAPASQLSQKQRRGNNRSCPSVVFSDPALLLSECSDAAHGGPRPLPVELRWSVWPRVKSSASLHYNREERLCHCIREKIPPLPLHRYPSYKPGN